MDIAHEAESLREAFLDAEGTWPGLKHVLLWRPTYLMQGLSPFPGVVMWEVVWPAGPHLQEAHRFRCEGSERDAKDARSRFERLVRRASDWTAELPDDVMPVPPHLSSGHTRYRYCLEWLDLLYLLGQDNRIRGLEVQTSWVEEEKGIERKATTLTGWELLDYKSTPPTRQPRLWEQSVVWTPSSKEGRNLYWPPRAWLQENLWYASAAAVRHLAEKTSALAPVPVPATVEQEPQEPTGVENVFRNEGEYWTVIYERQRKRLKDRVGLHYIAYLLGHPERPIDAVELGRSVPSAPASNLPGKKDVDGSVVGAREQHGQAMMDQQELEECAKRVSELDGEIEEAKKNHDWGKQEKLEEERESIIKQVRKDKGLRGRRRPFGGGRTKSAQTLCQAIRRAMAAIAKKHEALGDHFKDSLNLGSSCSYIPKHPTVWLT